MHPRRTTSLVIWSLALSALLALGCARECLAQSVTTYHGGPERTGNFVVPGLTSERARNVRLDPTFAPRFSGHVYAQPLYWQPSGPPSGELIVATESDTVLAIDARTGVTLWSRALGTPVPLSSQPCGNIDPLGITGTPVIDARAGTLYFDAMLATGSGGRHLVFALSLKDGATLPGWPIDVAAALAARGAHFDASVQNQRGALTILDGRVFVPYGGHFGDCGDYRGWVVGLALDNPRSIVSWHTRARGGGIWAPAGIANDGRWLYFATGNTFGAREWSDGEAVFKLPPDLVRSASRQDFFAPQDWRSLDKDDADLGGVTPLPLHVAANADTPSLILALGKDGHGYLLDAANLGGIGGMLVSEIVSSYPIRTAAAAFPAADGAFVAFQGPGAQCRAPRSYGGLTVLKIRGGSPQLLTTAWCGAVDGAGSPVVTTTDGRSNPIVWILGAEGDNRLHGFHGHTGEPLFDGGGPGDTMTGLHHFQDLLPAGGRLYIGADNRLYAFSY
jgi:outer membrane protein assembly factor BamB